MKRKKDHLMQNGHYYRSNLKKELTMADFLGLDAVVPEASSNIVKELDADEMQAFLKELDVDLGDVTWGGGEQSIIENVEYSGEEWCRYFRDVYGKDDVIWENATPSQLARSWQGTGKYPGVDNYIDVTVNKGIILYRGEPNGTEYFTTEDAIEQSGRDAVTLFEGLQVEKNPIHSYRGEIKDICLMKILQVHME